MEPNSCKAGWLLKKGEVRKGWKKRWFEIRDIHVYYYKKIGEIKPLGVIPLAPETTTILKYNIDEESPHRDSLCFRIQTPRRTFALQTQSEIEMFEWVNYLIKHQQEAFSPVITHMPQPDIRRKTLPKIELIRATSEAVLQPVQAEKSLTKAPTPPQIPVQQTHQIDVDVENQIDRLQTKLEEALTQITSMAMQSRQDKETISNLQSQLEKLTNESEAKSRKIDKLRSENETLQSKAHISSSKPIDVNLNSVQAELTKTKETLMAQLTHASFLNQQVTQLEKEKETLREKVSQYVDLLSELEPLKTENEELKHQLSKKNTDNAASSGQVDFLKERYFIAFTGQMKIQQVMQGKVCPISGLQLYEEAKAGNVPVEEYESWIKKKVELAVIVGNP